MTTTPAEARAGRGAPPVRGARALGVAAATAGAVGVWALIEPVLGVEVRGPAYGAATETSDVGAVQVLIVTASAGLAGWALLALLERFTARAARIWAGMAVLALFLSLGGPLSGSGVSSANRVALVILHLVVGAVLIPALYRSAQRTTSEGNP